VQLCVKEVDLGFVRREHGRRIWQYQVKKRLPRSDRDGGVQLINGRMKKRRKKKRMEASGKEIEEDVKNKVAKR
jgi:hypothetical protein